MNPKNDLNGFLVVDKPYDMGSTQVVSVLKRCLQPMKIGHAGTLDPLATGVLPIALGKATRLIPYVMAGKKTYIFTVRFGEEWDSDDLGGQLIAQNDKRPAKEAIEAILPKFIGEILQTPNAFSALRVAGKRAYELAREGIDVNLKARPVVIYALDMLDFRGEEADFRVTCSKGTYVRTLAHDLSRALNVLGVVTALHRTSCLPFEIKDAVDLEAIKNGTLTAENVRLFGMTGIVAHLPALDLTEEEVVRLSHGQRLSLKKLALPNTAENGMTRVQVAGQTKGLVRVDENTLRPEFIWES